MSTTTSAAPGGYDRRAPRRTAGELARGADLSRVSDAARRTALTAAGGDPQLLWVDDRGELWVLNHPRAQRCYAPACPACPSSRSRHGKRS